MLQRQVEIYTDGAAGKKPDQPVGYDRLREMAKEEMSEEAFAYVDCGAGGESTMRANVDAFERWRILPRMLSGVVQPDLNVELFGRRYEFPFLLAPIGALSIVHPDAETAVAGAAAQEGVGFVLSTVSSRPLEEVASVARATPRWFQLYWGKDPEFTASLLHRAEKAGFEVLIVTLDTMHIGWRERDLDNAFLPFLKAEGIANFTTDPVFRSNLDRPPEEDPAAAVRQFTAIATDPTLTWGNLDFLRGCWKGPIMVKGIQHPDDAQKAVDRGMDGVVVSNHGGRQTDGAVASLDALPDVVEAVGGRTVVMFDSGIRRGADAFKALALGARAVLLGRPYLWGLAARGEAGVRDVIRNFKADLGLTTALAGCGSLGEVRRDALTTAAPTHTHRQG